MKDMTGTVKRLPCAGANAWPTPTAMHVLQWRPFPLAVYLMTIQDPCKGL